MGNADAVSADFATRNSPPCVTGVPSVVLTCPGAAVVAFAAAASSPTGTAGATSVDAAHPMLMRRVEGWPERM
eukprot:6195301-Pleurochrysis_carterae.AAC.3